MRHYFPRASTDAMITWMITRPGLAMCWPTTVLPDIGQPLGGEVLFTREVAESLHVDPNVQAQSDWGIDTRYTIATTAAGSAPLRPMSHGARSTSSMAASPTSRIWRLSVLRRCKRPERSMCLRVRGMRWSRRTRCRRM